MLKKCDRPFALWDIKTDLHCFQNCVFSSERVATKIVVVVLIVYLCTCTCCIYLESVESVHVYINVLVLVIPSSVVVDFNRAVRTELD